MRAWCWTVLPEGMVACAAVPSPRPSSHLVTELQEPPPTTLDAAALYELVQERGRHIFWLYRVPRQEHEDILQQAFLAFLRKKESIVCPEAWLLGAVRNSCRLYWRAQRGRQETSVDAGLLDLLVHDPAQDLEVLRGQLRRAIDTMAPKCRAFLILRYRLELSPAEVARELHCTLKAAEKAGSRCVAALARRLLRIGGRATPRS